MACTVHNGRLHDTVTETSFGPQCETDDEASALLCHIRRTRAIDPRIAGYADINAALNEVRSGQPFPIHPDMVCACGSGLEWFMRSSQHRKVSTKCLACDGAEVPADRAEAIWRI